MTIASAQLTKVVNGEVVPLDETETAEFEARLAECQAGEAARHRAEFVSAAKNAVQKRLDDFAKTRDYDGISSAVSYVDDPDPQFAAEGQYCKVARSNTWATYRQIMSDIDGGQRQEPSVDALLEELPELTWPPML